MNCPERIIIIGAGPTGLGAAHRLKELGHKNWAIYEKEKDIGGLSASFKDDYGFTWDIGGHVMFSSNERFNTLADHLMGSDFISHERESWIRINDRWVPYPFQNNIRHLARESTLHCLVGLVKAHNSRHQASNFEDWIYKTFGEGIARLFMIPYNTKAWSIPLSRMCYGWIAERVSVIDVERIIRNIVMESDDVDWGANNTFKFPLYNGTGGFFNKFEPYMKGRIAYKKAVSEVALDSKTLTFQDGSRDNYDILINTSPLDMFVKMIRTSENDISHLREKASQLEHNGIYVVGIGLKKRMEQTKCWVYFPEEDIPFYRMTYFSHYSPNNVPEGDTLTFSSLMCEVSFSKYTDVKEALVVDATIEALVRAGILSEADIASIVSKWLKKVDYAYPIPTLERDNCLREIQSFLESNHIYSRGRFGAWKYEIGNMDHSVLMGIEVVDSILTRGKETIWNP